jgi:glycosyltransferase involved in cell wall biosynthesis
MNHDTKPKISIIIINKNDRGIADTLVALESINRPAQTETIVVDVSSDEVMGDIWTANPSVHWIYFKPSAGPKSSIPEQRNAGIQASRGDIIAFIDANCVPVKNWLVDLTAPILSGAETVTAGSTTAKNPKTLANINAAGKMKYLPSAATINLAFTRATYDEVGPFDESLHFGSDVDFTWRCIDAGHKIRYVPEASVSHDWGTTGDELRRSFKYGRAKFILYSKHSTRLKPLSEDLFVPMYLTYIALLPLTIWLPWYPLVIALPMLRNAGHRPFKTAVINFLFSLGFAREAIVRFFRHTKSNRPVTPKTAI